MADITKFWIFLGIAMSLLQPHPIDRLYAAGYMIAATIYLYKHFRRK